MLEAYAVIRLPDPQSHIIESPTQPFSGGLGIGNIFINVAAAADSFIAWGGNPRARDRQLRDFWPTEPHFASALFSVVAQYVAFGFSLSGPPRMVGISQTMLNSVEFGQGPEALLTKALIDYLTQDNGAWIEIVRTDDEPAAPCVSLNHLDSARCLRTGMPATPVMYIDTAGHYHLLKWYNVIELTEFPSPIETAHGLQYSALTRILRSAQIARDVAIVKQEKAGGRFTRQIHFVSGVGTRIIEDAKVQKSVDADQKGLIRFMEPLVIGTVDPTSKVDVATIDLASIPEDYDEQKALQTYITLLAMAFGTDYQNLAPLPGGGLGSGSQSKVINMKSRGKGPGLFMRKLARAMNFHGVIPRTVTFKFGEQDAAEQMERTEVRKARAEEREIRVRSGEITTEVARQMAVDDGDLDERYLIMMREENATHEITVPSVERAEAVGEDDVKPGMPGPKEAPKSAPPAGAVDRPGNSNAKRPRNPATNQKRNPGGTPEGRARA